MELCVFFPSAGFKLRKREISNEPTGGPGNCPHLVEAVPCDEPSCWVWRLVRLDECIPDGELPCGSGTQIPQVQCVNSTGEENHSNNQLSEKDYFNWIFPSLIPLNLVSIIVAV